MEGNGNAGRFVQQINRRIEMDNGSSATNYYCTLFTTGRRTASCACLFFILALSGVEVSKEHTISTLSGAEVCEIEVYRSTEIRR